MLTLKSRRRPSLWISISNTPFFTLPPMCNSNVSSFAAGMLSTDNIKSFILNGVIFKKMFGSSFVIFHPTLPALLLDSIRYLDESLSKELGNPKCLNNSSALFRLGASSFFRLSFSPSAPVISSDVLCESKESSIKKRNYCTK